MLSEEEIQQVKSGKYTRAHNIPYQVQMIIGERTLRLLYPNIEVCEYDKKLVILNNYPWNDHKYAYDVIAVDADGNVLWHMEDPKESDLTKKFFERFEEVAAVGICVINHNIVVTDFTGRHYILDPDTGKIVGHYACKCKGDNLL